MIIGCEFLMSRVSVGENIDRKFELFNLCDDWKYWVIYGENVICCFFDFFDCDLIIELCID